MLAETIDLLSSIVFLLIARLSGSPCLLMLSITTVQHNAAMCIDRAVLRLRLRMDGSKKDYQTDGTATAMIIRKQ